MQEAPGAFVEINDLEWGHAYTMIVDLFFLKTRSGRDDFNQLKTSITYQVVVPSRSLPTEDKISTGLLAPVTVLLVIVYY